VAQRRRSLPKEQEGAQHETSLLSTLFALPARENPKSPPMREPVKLKLAPLHTKAVAKPMDEAERKALEAQRERERIQRSQQDEWQRQNRIKDVYEDHLNEGGTLSERHEKAYRAALHYLRSQPNPYLQ
jgi:hypothetical protein